MKFPLKSTGGTKLDHWGGDLESTGGDYTPQYPLLAGIGGKRATVDRTKAGSRVA